MGRRENENQESRASLDLDALARELAPLVAPLVVAQLTRALGAAQGPYSERKGRGPEGVPDDEWKKIAKEIGRLPYPGARWRLVDRAVYEQWVAAQNGSPAPLPAPAANATEEPWSPRGALESVGLRATRRRA